MNIKNLHTVYFLGVGGIGMSAIARYFNSLDCKVLGYDKTKTVLTEQLESEGISIHYNEDIKQIPEAVKQQEEGTLVIYTPAIPKGNVEFQYLKEQGVKLYKRSEVLGLISENYFTIAIAGTHGKTTTSSIIAHILNECGINCIAFLGGISLNFNSNLLLNENPTTLVVEADEYDRSFLTLSPDIALITSIDADHLDVYGDKDEMKNAYSEFVGKIKREGELISKQGCLDVLDIRSDIKTTSYSISGEASISASNVVIKEGSYYVDIDNKRYITKDIKIGLPGIHNVENAVGAFAIADKLGLDQYQIKEALGTYKGVQRRFETHIKTNDIVYIDDYAHHPAELEMCINSVKGLYPGKKITGIFQPHLYSRTRDFIDEFATSLSLLDELLLLDIYPARELPIEGVTSELV
ncbi:MAG: UDP-N-acetylmuramate--L-alanine ligase, partial [Flavobacteriales bacterium]|nr:UDP-N-acetylmuramate--L-alanine ligase [Flavobacteriales bacterium]